MNNIRNWWQLPPADRWLAVKVLFFLSLSKLGLRLVPLKTLLKALAVIEKPPSEPSKHKAHPDQIVRLVKSLGTRVLHDQGCLAQAITAHLLLYQSGHPAKLRIGIMQSAHGLLQAYAWVEYHGVVLIGSRERENWCIRRLPALDRAGI